MLKTRTVRGCAFLALAALGACGGSGGGGGGPVIVVLDDATLSGTYFVVLKAGSLVPPLAVRGSTGTLTSDAAGNALHTRMTNDSGTITGPDTDAYTYDVAADGSLDLFAAVTLFGSGGVSADGDCALVGSVNPGAFPGFFVLLRRAGFHSPASLSGAYHIVGFLTDPATGDSSSATGSANFDGAGSGFTNLTVNLMGVILPAVPGGHGYTVIGDGTSTSGFGGDTLEGGVVGGGAAAVWGGSTTSGADPAVAAAVKAATSASVATLQGAYWIVLLERDPTSGEFRSLHGTATANGAGSLTLFSTSNTEGTIAVEPPQTTTYTVAADGTLTVDAGGNGLRGGVSQDGSFAVVGGGTAIGSSPTIVLLCRK